MPLLVQTTTTVALIKRINRKRWWHVQPQDPRAYEKRGKFFASSYDEAEYYGRPGEPQRVTVCHPLAGDEEHIEMTLLGSRPSKELEKLEPGLPIIQARLDIDARIKEAAVAKGYDSVALMTPKAWMAFQEAGKLPRSIELNVFL